EYLVEQLRLSLVGRAAVAAHGGDNERLAAALEDRFRSRLQDQSQVVDAAAPRGEGDAVSPFDLALRDGGLQGVANSGGHVGNCTGVELLPHGQQARIIRHQNVSRVTYFAAFLAAS